MRVARTNAIEEVGNGVPVFSRLPRFSYTPSAIPRDPNRAAPHASNQFALFCLQPAVPRLQRVAGAQIVGDSSLPQLGVAAIA